MLTKISEIEVPELLSDTWYSFQLIAVQGTFTLKMDQEKDPNEEPKFDEMSVILKGEDYELSKGRQGLYTDGIQKAYFDRFQVIPKDCITEPIQDFDLLIEPPKSNRFKETFFGGINTNWNILEIDPFYQKNGQPDWKFTSDCDRDKILTQDSSVISSDQYKQGSIILLRRVIQNQGSFFFNFQKKDSHGTFSAIFKYDTQKSYFRIDFESKKVVARQMMKGRQLELDTDESIKFKSGVWYEIHIKLKFDEIFVSYKKNKEISYNKLFNEQGIKIRDGVEIKGQLGFATQGTQACIDQIEITPEFTREDPNILADDSTNQFVRFKQDKSIKSDQDIRFKSKMSNQSQNESSSSQSNSLSKNKIHNESIKSNSKSILFDYDTCIQKKNPEARDKYCQDKFRDINQISHCKSNFCDSCCKENIDWMHKSQLRKCNKECSAYNEVPIKDANSIKKYQQICINPKELQSSIYEYCSDTFFTSEQENQYNQCVNNMCQLCCTIFSGMDEKQYISQIQIKDCRKECDEIYNINIIKKGENELILKQNDEDDE